MNEGGASSWSTTPCCMRLVGKWINTDAHVSPRPSTKSYRQNTHHTSVRLLFCSKQSSPPDNHNYQLLFLLLLFSKNIFIRKIEERSLQSNDYLKCDNTAGAYFKYFFKRYKFFVMGHRKHSWTNQNIPLLTRRFWKFSICSLHFSLKCIIPSTC